MALTAYDPFTLMNQLQDEVSRMFDTRAGNERGGQGAYWVPPVDIREEPGQFVINADLPGVDPKEIEITMEKGVLSLRGARPADAAADKNGFKRRERPAGSFYRRFVMPESADAEGITAQGKNGVLQVVIPKRQKAQARRIQVEG
jgi:HSP20 family protein